MSSIPGLQKYLYRCKGQSGRIHLAKLLGPNTDQRFGTLCGSLIPVSDGQPGNTPLTCAECLKEMSVSQLIQLYLHDTATAIEAPKEADAS